MTANRKRNQAQALPLNRRRMRPPLQVVPRNVVSSAEASVAGVRRNILRNIDFHPALYILTGVAILSLVAFIYLGQVTAVTNANYTLQALQSDRTKLLREQQDLELQIARAQSLAHIEDVAKTKLQMVPIGDRYRYVTIPPGPLTSIAPEPTTAPTP
jgi:cell division protein FtsL